MNTTSINSISAKRLSWLDDAKMFAILAVIFYHCVPSELTNAGDVKELSFTQKMTLQGGEYLISFGVTGFEQNDFTVYHRLYDALNITVVSDKNTVGYYDMESKCVVQDAKE